MRRYKRIVVYADLLFMFNLLMDTILLWLTASIRKISYRKWRILVAAGCGASYVVLLIFPPLSMGYSLIGKCLFGMLMIWIAYGFVSVSQYFKNISTFMMMNFSVAGGIWGLHYLQQPISHIFDDVVYSSAQETVYLYRPTKLFVLIGLALGLTLWLFFFYRGTRERQMLTTCLADIVIEIGEDRSMCKGLVDTGNQLYEPLTRMPVLIAEASLWEAKIPLSWMQSIRNSNVDTLFADVHDEPFAWQDRLRLIPYRGVNRSTQFMIAVKPDRVIITHQETQYETSQVLVAFDGGVLSARGDYQVIIHPALLNP